MPFPRVFAPRMVTPILSVALIAVLAVAWGRGPATVSASTSSGSAEQGGSCPLTAAQELNSIKTFLKMMPVFRHPRCLNCHGAMPNPLPQRVQIGGVWQYPAAPPPQHAGVVVLDSTSTNRTCEDCHVDDWGAASAAPDWTRRNDIDLCIGMHAQFKDEGGAPAFIDHIVRDRGQPPGFIKLAFQGKRGLLDGGQTIYENETGRTFTAAPPPGTHAQLIQRAKDWVAAQGGSFVGDDECGCVLDKMEVLFRSTLHIVNNGPAKETGTITGEGSIILKLGPDPSEPGWDVTTGQRGVSRQGSTARITWSGVKVTRSNGCLIDILASPPTLFSFWLGMSYHPELKFSLQVVPEADMHGSRLRCPRPAPLSGMVTAQGADSTPHIFSAGWSALHGGPNAQPMAGLAVPKPGAMPVAPPGGLDMTKIMSLDPKALEAMAEAMKNNPTPAGMAQIGALMNQVVPGADKMAAEAANNFKFAIPDDPKTKTAWCKLQPGTAYLATCSISQTITVPDNKGSTQTITETTNISIGRTTKP
jgi:hypothetical protein